MITRDFDLALPNDDSMQELDAFLVKEGIERVAIDESGPATNITFKFPDESRLRKFCEWLFEDDKQSVEDAMQGVI